MLPIPMPREREVVHIASESGLGICPGWMNMKIELVKSSNKKNSIKNRS